MEVEQVSASVKSLESNSYLPVFAFGTSMDSVASYRTIRASSAFSARPGEPLAQLRTLTRACSDRERQLSWP
jgi:hypothetical protein